MPNEFRHFIRLRTACLLFCAVMINVSAHAGQPAARQDPQLARGERLARLVCSACHVVASDQEWPPLLEPPAPSFAEIAQRPSVSAASLQTFIRTTHWDEKTLPMHMPDLQTSKDDARDVVRYILSRRKP